METGLGIFVKRLFSENSEEREEARQKLVKIGKPVIPYLVGLQYLHEQRVGWQAIKILNEIAHPDAIPILVNGLENEDTNIRWLAAVGLISIGEPSLMPVLGALEFRGGSKFLREGVHHVLKGLKEKGLFTDTYGLIKMLEDPAKQMLVAPTAATIHLSM